jgi:hypothetical protein
MSVEQKINELLEQAKELENDDSVVLTTEDLDALTDDEVAHLIENIDQLDDQSKSVLVSYVNSLEEDTDNAAELTNKVKAKAGNGDTSDLKNTATEGQETKDRVIKKGVSKDGAGEQTAVAEDIDLGDLLSTEGLTEEFKAKAATIFESAVAARVAQEVAAYKEELAEEADAELEQLKEGLIDKVDGFLGYVTEQWMTKNELALERGIKADLFESFMSGMQKLFTEHYVAVPEEQLDVLESMQEQIARLESMVNESTEHNIELVNTLNEVSKAMQIEEATEGLSETQTEKFKALAEAIVYEDDESFSEKLTVIRENYFAGKEKTPVLTESVEFISDEPVVITEETSVKLTPEMSAYTKAIR